jgi:hypothetical protein
MKTRRDFEFEVEKVGEEKKERRSVSLQKIVQKIVLRNGNGHH